MEQQTQFETPELLIGMLLSVVTRFRVRRPFRVAGGDPGIYNTCKRMLEGKVDVQPAHVMNLLNYCRYIGLLDYTLKDGYEPTDKLKAMFTAVETECDRKGLTYLGWN